MLMAHVERYISLRKHSATSLTPSEEPLRICEVRCRSGEAYVRVSTAEDWAAGASSPFVRYIRLRDVTRLARFLHAEDKTPDPIRSVPRTHSSPSTLYYTAPQEIVHSWKPPNVCASPIRCGVSLRHMIGLMAATGLRISEALNLCLHDVLPDGSCRSGVPSLGRAVWSPYTQQR